MSYDRSVSDHYTHGELPDAVQIKKNYVAYHLMPVYVFPELLSGISPELGHRMQGKSCFNFKATDQTLFRELEQITAAGYQRYKEAGYI